MSMDMHLSSALQRRLVNALMDVCPLPWAISHEASSDYLTVVVDAKHLPVLNCANEDEASELIDAAEALATANAKMARDLDRATSQERERLTPPKTVDEFFDRRLPSVLEKAPSRARELNAIFFFKITSSDLRESGSWLVDLVSNPPTCKADAGTTQRSSSDHPTCIVMTSADNLLAILRDPEVLMKLYFQGKFVVSGDSMQAVKLKDLFSLLSI